MKVKTLIKILSDCDENLDVLLNDELTDNLLDINSIDIISTYDENFVMISMDYKEESVLVS